MPSKNSENVSPQAQGAAETSGKKPIYAGLAEGGHCTELPVLTTPQADYHGRRRRCRKCRGRGRPVIERSKQPAAVPHRAPRERSPASGRPALIASASGKDCTLGDGVRPHTRDPLRRVRASFPRFLALGGDDSVKVGERGVVLKGACVEDQLDLVGAHCERALLLTNCFFVSKLALDYAHLPMIMLDGSRVPGIMGDR